MNNILKSWSEFTYIFERISIVTRNIKSKTSYNNDFEYKLNSFYSSIRELNNSFINVYYYMNNNTTTNDNVHTDRRKANAACGGVKSSEPETTRPHPSITAPAAGPSGRATTDRLASTPGATRSARAKATNPIV